MVAMITELIALKLIETLARKQGWIQSRPTLGKLLAKTAPTVEPLVSPLQEQHSEEPSPVSDPPNIHDHNPE